MGFKNSLVVQWLGLCNSHCRDPWPRFNLCSGNYDPGQHGKKKKGMWALMCTPVFETQLLLLPGSITLSKLFIISELSFPYLYTGDSSA